MTRSVSDPGAPAALRAGAPPTEGDSDPSAKGSARWVWGLALAGLLIVVAAQVAGLTFGRWAEGRRPISLPPPESFASAPLPRAEAAPRFGPEVHEVPLATIEPGRPSAAKPDRPRETPPPAPSPPAREAAPAAVAAAAPSEEQTASEDSGSAPDSPPQTAAPVSAGPPGRDAQVQPSPGETVSAGGEAPGTHVLQAGVFRSQRYRRELEDRLDHLGVPHFRTVSETRGQAFRLVIPVSSGEETRKAEDVLTAGGYLFRPQQSDALETHLYLEEEAKSLLDRLTAAGLTGGYQRVEGPIPTWTVYAGPYMLEEAKAVRARLAGQGLETYLRKRP